MNVITRLIVSTLAVFTAAYISPGVHVQGFTTAIAVAIVLGLLNVIVKPILIILTIPFTILTLGLFLLIINAIIVLLCSGLVTGFEVDGIWYALLFSLIVSLITAVLNGIAGEKKRR